MGGIPYPASLPIPGHPTRLAVRGGLQGGEGTQELPGGEDTWPRTTSVLISGDPRAAERLSPRRPGRPQGRM